MKQKLLKTMLLLCALVVGSSSVWAADLLWSHTFASPQAISDNTITVGGATWTVSTTSGSGSPSMSTGTVSSTYGLKFGSSKSVYYGSVTFTTNYFKDYNVKSITVNILNNGKKTGTLTAQQGVTSIGTTSSEFGQTWTDLTVNTNTGSGGTFSFTYSVEQAFYIHSISVTYEEQVAAVAKPTFSVAGGTYTVVKNVEISCATDGATIYYTTDGTDPTSSSTPYSSAVSIDHTCTLKAIAIKGEDTSNIATAAYTINLPTNYNLASTITSGKHYVIANNNEDGSVRIMNTQNTNNRGYMDATVSSNVLTATGAVEFVIQGPDADGLYTIYDASATGGYLYAASGGNYLRTQASVDVNARWAISIDGDGVASIVATKSSNNNVMQYNASNKIFSCYSSASQSDVYLFEKDGEATPSESVTVTSAGYATYASNNALDFTGKSIEAYIATTKGDGSGVTFTQVKKIPARTGVLLHADGGATVDIPVLTGAADAVTGNKFVKGTGENVATDGTTVWNYILNNVGGNIGFYQAAGQKVAANRAYISILKSESASVKEFIALPGFEEDDATSLSEELRMKNEESDNVIYNLAGQRLQKMQKGINIVNGKKVLF